MARSLLSRLKALQNVPDHGVTFFLEDGSKYRHPGPALDTVNAIMAEMRAGNSMIARIVRETVGASNCGFLWQIPQALDPATDLQELDEGMKQEEGKSLATERKYRPKNRKKKK